MPRLSKEIKKKIAKAEKKARKQVLIPKRRRRNGSGNKEQQERAPTTRWIKDERGTQGEVFFDGYNYWGTVFIQDKDDPTIKHARPKMWTPDEWEKRGRSEAEEQKQIDSPEKPKQRRKRTLRVKKSGTKQNRKRTRQGIKNAKTTNKN